MIPLLIGGLALLAAYKVGTDIYRKGVMTEERRAIYEAAMNRKPGLEPDKLQALAAEFDKAGLPSYADELRKRALLRGLPPEVHTARKAAIQKALASTDPIGVRMIANACQAEGMYGTAETLREYAESLDHQAFVNAIVPNPTPTAPSPAAVQPQVPIGPPSPTTTVDSSGASGGPVSTIDWTGAQASSPDQSNPSGQTSDQIQASMNGPSNLIIAASQRPQAPPSSNIAPMSQSTLSQANTMTAEEYAEISAAAAAQGLTVEQYMELAS